MFYKPNGDIVIYACSNGEYFGKNIVRELNALIDKKNNILKTEFGRTESLMSKVELHTPKTQHFPNSMNKYFLRDGVRGRDVYIVQWFPKSFIENGHDTPYNEMEFLDAVAAACQSGAKRVTIVTPYLGRQRDDTREGRSPIGAQQFAALVGASIGKKEVNGLCYDPHNITEVGFYIDHGILMEPVPPFQIVSNHLKEKHSDFLKDAVILLPDVGGSKRADEFSNWLNLPMVNVGAIRRSPTEKETQAYLPGNINLNGKNLALFDDILGTGTTGGNAAEEVSKNADIGKIIWAMSHSEMTNPQKLVSFHEKGLVDKILVPDTTPVGNHSFIEEYKLSPVFAEIIWNLNHDMHIGSFLKIKYNGDGI